MRGSPFSIPVAKPDNPPPEAYITWWNPSQAGVRGGPEWFVKKLHEIDPNLNITWNNFTERWQIWVRKPRSTNPFTRGWQLLFVVKYSDGSYAPLDERTLSKLFEISGDKWGNARSYFNHVQNEFERGQKQMEDQRVDSVKAGGREYFDYLQ